MKKAIHILVIALALSSNQVWAQKSALSPDAEAIAVYPLNIRQAAQTALQNLDTLAKIGQIQAKSHTQFTSLISSLPKETQQQVWQMIRYPTLIQELAGGEVKDVKNFPKEIQPIARQMMEKNFDLLVKIDALDDAPQRQFDAISATLSEPARSAFQTLIREPAVLNALIKNLGFNQLSPADYANRKAALQIQAQQLSAQIKSAAKPPSDQIPVAKGDNSKDISDLQKAENQLDQNLGYEQNTDPHGKPNAAQMDVNYSPYPFYNAYMGRFSYPIWFGWPAWGF